jgi:type IV secretory pathway VirB6-like protein
MEGTLMRNLLALAALLLIAFGVLGYYRGWYTIQKNTASDGHPSYTVDIDSQKIQADVKETKQEVGELLIKKN